MPLAKEDIDDQVKLLMDIQQRVVRVEENTKRNADLVTKVDDISEQVSKAHYDVEDANHRIDYLRDMTYGMVVFIAVYIIAPIFVDIVSKFLQ